MNLKQIRIPYAVLKKTAGCTPRQNNFQVKCVIRTTPNDMFVYDIFGKDEDVVVGGLAVDIGTTTVSAVLHQYGERRDSGQKLLPETDRSVLVQMLSTVSSNHRNPVVRRNFRMQ